MYVIVWEFQPAPGREAEFERAYGTEGDWVQFFRRDPEYRGTDLFRDVRDAHRFITVDRWTSREACDAFAKREARQYRELDERLAPLCGTETRIGSFAS